MLFKTFSQINNSFENLYKGCYNYKNDVRLILEWQDATINDSSIEHFDKLGWLPIDDIIRIRKLFMLHKVSQGHCPEYFTSYFKHVRSTHGYRTRSAVCNECLTPSCKRNSSACCLWKNLGNSYRNITSPTDFRKMLQNNLIKENSLLKHFKISRTF